MQPIFQHILVGINEAGRVFISETSQLLQNRGFQLSDRMAVKLLINAGGEGEIEYPAVIDDQHGDKADPSESPADESLDRRRFLSPFLESFPRLEEIVKARWREAVSPELKIELARAGYEFKGQKVFIVADIFDGASSALILPLMAALKYALRKEGISDVHWNVLAMAGPRRTPSSGILAYAFLRELSFLRKKNEPEMTGLSTPPFTKEVPLFEGEPALYILDSSGAGAAPLSISETAQMAARYVFVETFQDAPLFAPSDREVYFHSFGISQAGIDLDETVESVAYRCTILTTEAMGLKPDEVPAKSAEDALKRRKIDPEELSGRIPDFSQYLWKSPSIDLAGFKSPALMMDGPGRVFSRSFEEQEKTFKEVFITDAENIDIYRELKDKTENLLYTELYGIAAAMKLIESAGVRIKELYNKASSMKIPPPSTEEMNRRVREMSGAFSAGMPFAVIMTLFFFTFIPISSTVRDFIMWKYPSADPSGVNLGILIAAVVLSALGGWVQKYLMETTLLEKFEAFSRYMEEFYKSQYLHRLTDRAEKYYLTLLGLLTGENSSSASLLSKMESIRESIKNFEFKPEIRRKRFYGSLLLWDPEDPLQLKDFAGRFLCGADWPADKNNPWVSETLFESVKGELAINNDKAGSSAAESLYSGFKKLLLELVRRKLINISAVTGSMDQEQIQPVFENLRDFSRPLASVSDNRLAEEANCRMDEKIILAGEDLLKAGVLSELSKKYGFTGVPLAQGGNVFFLLQTYRYVQLYKLKDLEDWKYYEEKVDPETRRSLYLSDVFIDSPHIDYQFLSERGAENAGS